MAKSNLFYLINLSRLIRSRIITNNAPNTSPRIKPKNTYLYGSGDILTIFTSNMLKSNQSSDLSVSKIFIDSFNEFRAVSFFK